MGAHLHFCRSGFTAVSRSPMWVRFGAIVGARQAAAAGRMNAELRSLHTGQEAKRNAVGGGNLLASREELAS